MADTTLAQIETAIQQVLTCGESWAMGDVKRATDLEQLIVLRDRLRASSAQTSMFSLATFGSPKSES